MFYFVLVLFILLCAVALLVAILNLGALTATVPLVLAGRHLPGIPIFLLCLFAAFLGGLLLYVVSSIGARRDAREIANLREHIEELTRAQVKSPSGGLGHFQPPVVPIPGFSPPGAPQPLSSSMPSLPSTPPGSPPTSLRSGFFPPPPNAGPRPPSFPQH